MERGGWNWREVNKWKKERRVLSMESDVVKG